MTTETFRHSGEQLTAHVMQNGAVLCPHKTCNDRCPDIKSLRTHLTQMHGYSDKERRTCDNCGTEFVTRQCKDHQYCSIECANASVTESRQELCQYCRSFLSTAQQSRGYCDDPHCERLARLADAMGVTTDA